MYRGAERRSHIPRRQLAIGIVLAVLATASWWYARYPTAPIGLTDPRVRHDPDYIIEKFTATAMNERGSPKYRLTAQRLTHYPDDDTAHLIQPVLVQYLPGGAIITTYAERGLMPGDGSEILMTGNVRAKRTGDLASPGGEMRTDRLRIELDR